MAREIPDIALNNGVKMPSIGLGTPQDPGRERPRPIRRSARDVA